MKKKQKKWSRWGFNSANAEENLPYIFFLMLLAMIYIGNAHWTEKKVRKIDSLKTEIRELTWMYMSVKSDAIYRATYSSLNEKVQKKQFSNKNDFPKKLGTSKK